MNSWYHAQSSAKKWGGHPSQYIEIHEFIDSSKKIIGDHRHRSIYHHTEGVWLCQRIFGRTITVGGRFAVPQELSITDPNEPDLYPTMETINYGRIRQVPVRLIAELHIVQDLGWLPSPKDYIDNMELVQWMGGPVRKERSIESVFPSSDPPPAPIEADLDMILDRANTKKWNFRRIEGDYID